MIIVGIDPGIVSTGYGLISANRQQAKMIDYGTIYVEKECEFPKRLALIYDQLVGICQKYKPEAFSIEDIFFSRNKRTAMLVGNVRGALILAGVHQKLPVFSYTPMQIKQAVTGYGKADKEQVQKMVKVILKLEAVPQPDHAADALAAALCYYYNSRYEMASAGWRKKV